ncbi:ComEC/Rec2 family competence protein [Flavicella marina]|uniref:ComEC/Rec2 family competence protein n=1 Tax=Flavicella marina TaxID=1475951 RepID=UPI0012657352|nr:ComEC/Rec2 family competence protein [Flavicella marina]
MKSVFRYIPMHILLFYVIGVFYQYYTKTPLAFSIWILCAVACLLLLKFKVVFRGTSMLLVFLLGMYAMQVRQVKEAPIAVSATNYVFEIDAVLKSTNYSSNFYGYIHKGEKTIFKERVLIKIMSDSLSNSLAVGDFILANTKLVTLKKSMNPYGFDYKNYLAKKNIHRQVVIDTVHWILSESKNTSWRRSASLIQQDLGQHLKRYINNQDVLAITTALLLGDRKNISTEVRESYTDAGVIHIFAVSGLHVGLLVVLLHFFLSPLRRFRYGKIISLFLIVLFLWSYAFIAGLSSSVVRAVTMFSFISFGIVLQKNNSIYHSIITSALILLLVNPYLIFDLGFVMSYVAVVSIVVIYPLFQKLWSPKNSVLRFVWNLMSVSISAQLGLLPICLYYFHQFPGLFIVSNLVVLPCLGLILILGLLVLICAKFQINIKILFECYSFIIEKFNVCIDFISKQEAWLWDVIYFSKLLLVVSYLLLISFVFLFYKITLKRIHISLLAVFVFQLAMFYELYVQKNYNELVIFQQYKKSSIAVSNEGKVRFFGTAKNEKLIESYLVKTGADLIMSREEVPNLINYKSQNIFIIDNKNFYKVPNFQPEILVLRNSPKIHLERCLKLLKPRVVVADGSSYPQVKERWKITCLKYKVHFHDTQTDGAFVLK